MACKLTKEIIETHIHAISARDKVSSYTDFYDLLLAALRDDGHVLSGEEERLMRRTLREKAPLGVTDLDDRAVSAIKEKPWYLGMLAFIALCAAGGVIEYFVQIPLDRLTGKTETSVNESDKEDTYRLAIATDSECRDVLRQLVLNHARFQLVEEEATKNPPQATLSIKKETDGFSYRVMAKGREQVLDEGTLPENYLGPLKARIEHLFPVEGYVILSEEKVLWCDIGIKQGVRMGQELRVYRPGKKVHHPITNVLLSVEEHLLGLAYVVSVSKDTCRAKIAEQQNVLLPGPGDIVRSGRRRKLVARKPYRKKMFYEFLDGKSIVRIERRLTNDQNEPLDHITGLEGVRSGGPPVTWVEMDGIRGPDCEILVNDGRRVKFKCMLPKPIPPGSEALLFLCLETGRKVTKLSDGSFRALCTAGNRPAIDYLVIAKLPWGSQFLRSDMFPTRVMESHKKNDKGQSQPVVVFKTSQPKNHHLSIALDYSFSVDKE